MNDEIKLLSLGYDLKPISEQEIAGTMMEVCAIYIECIHGISTETEEARIRVEYVAEEIMRRRWLPDFTYSMQDIPESIMESDTIIQNYDMVIN